MSQENVDRVLELLDAFNRRDLDAFVALTDDEVEVESRLVAMWRNCSTEAAALEAVGLWK